MTRVEGESSQKSKKQGRRAGRDEGMDRIGATERLGGKEERQVSEEEGGPSELRATQRGLTYSRTSTRLDLSLREKAVINGVVHKCADNGVQVAVLLVVEPPRR